MTAAEWKSGASSCAENSIDRDVFLRYKDAKIDMMEISLSYDKYKDIDWKNTLKYSKETGVGLWSFHLPFAPFESNNIASFDGDVRKNTILMQSEYIKRASEIGIKIFVIHPSGEPNPENTRSDAIKYARESLIKLADVAGENGAVIAVEDLPRTCLGNCSKEIKELISVDDRLKVCFDTNHLLFEKNTDFIKELGEKIITLHVSDYDFVDEKHWLPYEGKNDWVELVSELEKCGYNGTFMYEVGLKTPPTIKRRNLTYEDIRKNYEACVNKRTAEIITV